MSQTFDFAQGDRSCCTIYEPPAIIKWGSFGMYNFRKTSRFLLDNQLWFMFLSKNTQFS